MKFTFTGVVALVSLVLTTTAPAKEIAMEAYGDSITAAFLSGTQVTNAPTLEEMGKIWSDLAMYKISGDKKYLTPHHKPNLAWPQLIADIWTSQGHTIKLKNYAISGAKTKDLISQLGGERTADATSFFFMGHNDLCDNKNTPEAIGAQFGKEYKAALKLWDSKHVGATAYVIPVADIHRVYKTLEGYVWHNRDGRTYRCEDSWTKYFPYCTSYYKKLKDGTLEEFLAPRIAAMNEAVDKVVSEADRDSGRNHYKTLVQFKNKAYEKDYFAVDCFHLSKEGQSALAENVAKEIGRP